MKLGPEHPSGPPPLEAPKWGHARFVKKWSQNTDLGGHARPFFGADKVQEMLGYDDFGLGAGRNNCVPGTLL